MNRGFNIPKVSTESAALGIFDGLEKGEEEIFPIPRPGPSRMAGAMGYPRRLRANSPLSCRSGLPALKERVLISDRKTKEK